jgi:hypothetical protein
MKKIFPLLIFCLPVISFSQTTIDFGPDFNLCQDYIHILDAGPGFDSYLWQDGSTLQTFMVTEVGTFWVHAYIGTTLYSDTINLGYWPYPDPDLGHDTLICFGNSLILEPPPVFISYLWINGSTLPYLIVTDEGLYFVTVVDVHGCIGSDSIYVDFTADVLELGNDTTICELDTLMLNAGDHYVSYEWQDGSTEQYLSVSGSVYGVGFHEFSVTVLDTNNCQYQDTVMVYICEHFGIGETDGNSIQLYPNPAENSITLNLSGFQDEINSITIFNIFGEPVFRQKGVQAFPEKVYRLNVDHLNAGVYFLKAGSRNKEYSGKFLKTD